MPVWHHATVVQYKDDANYSNKSHCRYVEDVPALLSHCFGSRSVSREFNFFGRITWDYVLCSHRHFTRRCFWNLPDCSDGSAVLWAAGLLNTEGWTQCSLIAAGGVTAAATEFFCKYMYTCIWVCVIFCFYYFVKLLLQKLFLKIRFLKNVLSIKINLVYLGRFVNKIIEVLCFCEFNAGIVQ